MHDAVAAAPVTERAPAKVNLYLHVTGRRSDGYHLLDSLVVFADCGDRITVAAAPTLEFEVAGPFATDVPSDGDNLVVRAATALAAAAGRPAQALIRLEKRLPVASGIGGGSADAAAALRALARLWDLMLPPATLAAVALRLGADVPMCLAGRPAFVSGIGEDLAPSASLPGFALVLVNPRVPVPTPAVFKARSGPFSPPAVRPLAATDAAALAAALAERRNDLTAPAVAIAPIIAEVLAALSAAPGVLLARMSGSGGTCFGLCADLATARAAAADLARRSHGWWIEAAPLASAEPRD